MTITPTRHSEGGSRQSKPRASAESASRVVNESGIEIKPLYTAQDVLASGELDASPPGEPPFTRGIHPPDVPARALDHAPVHRLRQRRRYQPALQISDRQRPDRAQRRLRSADPMRRTIPMRPKRWARSGRVGMAVDTLRDFEIAFEGIDLDAITVSLTINGAAAILIAMYLAMAEKRGYDLARLRGTAQNDILKEFIGRGTWVYPGRSVGQARRRHHRVLRARSRPNTARCSVCGYHIRESGATPAEEMAYAFCIAKAYADAALARGLDIDEFAGRLSFNFNIFGNLFEQVAKFRAGRRLWAKIMLEQYGAKKPGFRLDAHDRRRRRLRAHLRAAGEQHHARRLLRADRRARRRADHGAVLLRRGLHHSDAEGAAHFAAHHAAPDRGDGADRHGRSARRLLLRRDAHQPDGAKDHGGDAMGRRARAGSSRRLRRAIIQASASRNMPISGSARSRPARCARWA